MISSQENHVKSLLENQPDLSNVRIARLSGATQYAVAKRREAMGMPPLVMRKRGKAT